MKQLKEFTGVVQIAGVMDWEEAKLLMDEGVDAIGFPLGLPIHREDLTISESHKIVKKLSNHVPVVLITYFNKARQIHEICQATGIEMIQIHGKISLWKSGNCLRLIRNINLLRALWLRGITSMN